MNTLPYRTTLIAAAEFAIKHLENLTYMLADVPCVNRTRLQKALTEAISAVRADKRRGHDPLHLVFKAAKDLQDHIVTHKCKGWNVATTFR